MDICKVIGCSNPHYCGGFCSKHYNRQLISGTTDDGPRARADLEQRLWRSVKRGKPDECWPWIGKSRTTGYGVLSFGGRGAPKMLSHRVAWFVTNGPIPKLRGHHGGVIRHRCHNRLCCNPAHLMLGTQRQNVEDMWANLTKPRANARLTEAQVEAIRNDPRSSRVLAPIYGVSDGHIRNIRRAKAWR